MEEYHNMQQEKNYVWQNQKKNICTFSCSKWKISRKKYENVVLISTPPSHPPALSFRILISTAAMIFISSTEISRESFPTLLCRHEGNPCGSIDHEEERQKHARKIILREGFISRWKFLHLSLKSIFEIFPQHDFFFRRERNLSFKGMVQFWVHSLYLEKKKVVKDFLFKARVVD